MKTPARFTVKIALAAGIFLAGFLANRQSDPAISAASGVQELRYSCPMHPQYTSDRSGTCPVCGMSLVAAPPGSQVEAPSTGGPAVQGTVQVGIDRQQLAGVRTDEVRQATASQSIRVPGRVAVDDTRLYRISAAAEGWIRELGNNPPGTFVKKNQVLGSYYAPNTLAAQQTLLFATGPSDLFGTDTAELARKESAAGRQRPIVSYGLQTAVDALRSLGMNDLQIQEVRERQQPDYQIRIYSPVSGFVISRNISPKERFDKGAEMYRIGDIARVWVMADIFEKDREFVKPGATAMIRYQGREFQARLSDALPQLDPQTRTLKTRFELDNPGNILLPDMFVDVELEVGRPAAITVPSDAVIDSGLRKTVYVDRGNGVFEPRLVETGWRLGDRVQIMSGLEPGERIVVSGNFLIDSESRMRLPVNEPVSVTKGAAGAKDLVCGMSVDPKAPGTLKSEYKGETYYFCAENCKTRFEANPAKYVPSAVAAQDMHGTHDTR